MTKNDTYDTKIFRRKKVSVQQKSKESMEKKKKKAEIYQLMALWGIGERWHVVVLVTAPASSTRWWTRGSGRLVAVPALAWLLRSCLDRQYTVRHSAAIRWRWSRRRSIVVHGSESRDHRRLLASIVMRGWWRVTARCTSVVSTARSTAISTTR